MDSALRSVIKKAFIPSLDLIDSTIRSILDLVAIPPLKIRARYAGLLYLCGSRWLTVGEQMMKEVCAFCDLTPDQDVLEIGCGAGIVALPLRSYLNTGKYTGIDIHGPSIAWCQASLGDDQFRFVLLDIKNEFYNPDGSIEATKTRFPFTDNEFDVVFLISVLTHLFPVEVENYLAEIARVMKPSGRCLATMLTRDRYQAGKSKFRLNHSVSDDCMCADPKQPAKALAFSSSLIRQMAENRGLRIKKMAPGSWDGVTHAPYLHDMYVFEKKGVSFNCRVST
jgi:SAM-dependent methyltransferase